MRISLITSFLLFGAACQESPPTTCDEVFFPDQDGDGYGDPEAGTTSCSAPSGYVENDDDCDDTDPALSPSTRWYADEDGDGYGVPTRSAAACVAPAGYVDNADDCDDNEASLNPGTPWYGDADGDGYGDESSVQTGCDAPPNTTGTGGDCNDSDAEIHPGATEICDDIDQDCDGDVSAISTWYTDQDQDGHGVDDGSSTSSCEAPGDAWALVADDCDDQNADRFPDNREVCSDGVDQDCDEVDRCAWEGAIAVEDGAEIPASLGTATEHGSALLGLGDTDGDGRGELAVGRPGTGQQGEVGLFFGAEGGLDSTRGIALGGASADDGFGAALAPGFDPTGGGAAALLVGAPATASNGAGAAWLFLGPFTTDLDTGDAQAKISGSTAVRLTGSVVAGDGAAVLVGGQSSSDDTWGAWLFTTMSSSMGIEEAPTYVGGLVAGAVAPAGIPGMAFADVDGDGQGDAILGDPGEGAKSDGQVVIFFDLASLGGSLDKSDADVIIAGRTYGQLGASVARLPDTDGDGVDDLLLGAPGRGTRLGVALVFLGGSGLSSGTYADAEASLNGPGTSSAKSDATGIAVAGLDDAQGDGLGDALVSASVTGVTYLAWSPLSGEVDLASKADLILTGDASEGAGEVIGQAGDIDGDTYGDWAIGASVANSAWLFLGGP